MFLLNEFRVTENVRLGSSLVMPSVDAELARQVTQRFPHHFDLTMHLREDPAREHLSGGKIVYSTELFDRETIETMVSRWLLLLDRLVRARSSK